MLFAVMMVALALGACVGVEGTAGPPPGAPEPQRLRVGNLSDQPIEGLVVLFPGAAWDGPAARVEIGDVPSGELSDYVEVPGGVYRYAAYEYVLDGERLTQPVTDWVGESPMAGRAFTYELSFDPDGQYGQHITLVAVTVDEE